MKTIVATLGIAGAAALLGAAPAAAQEDYPSKPINFWLTAGAGGMTDVSTRILAEKMEEILGVDILVESRPGGAGAIAINAMLNEPHDGYTVTSFSSGVAAATELLDIDVNIDEFVFLGSYMPQERVLFARQEAPFETVPELIEYAKEQPVTFADGGSYWTARVVEAFAKQHDLKLRMVPFVSGAEGSAAILGGHVSLAETGVGTSAWLAARDAGTLNMLAVLTDGDLAEHGFPDVPNIQEFGTDYVVRQYYAYGVPKDVPAERVEILSNALKEALADPEVIEQFERINLTPKWMPPEEYTQLLQEVVQQAAELDKFLEKSE